jgi:hypothetical protein
VHERRARALRTQPVGLRVAHHQHPSRLHAVPLGQHPDALGVGLAVNHVLAPDHVRHPLGETVPFERPQRGPATVQGQDRDGRRSPAAVEPLDQRLVARPTRPCHLRFGQGALEVGAEGLHARQAAAVHQRPDAGVARLHPGRARQGGELAVEPLPVDVELHERVVEVEDDHRRLVAAVGHPCSSGAIVRPASRSCSQ